MSLIAELKRRNVFKVGIAYLALAWVIVQITGTVAPAFGLPDWTLKLVVWIGLIGFPFVVVFSWIFELTPEGLKLEREIDRSQSITHQTSRKLDYVIIGMLALAIAVTALDRLLPVEKGSESFSSENDSDPFFTEADRGQGPLLQEQDIRVQRAATPGTNAPAPDDKSIAVLPFVDMSQAGDQAYFSDGIAEELLNLLAKIPELKVIARTSSFAFKGEKTDIAEIAKKLHVAHVLEGSVRVAGNRVRITTQLVRASDSTHLWSETYDRTLDDIFAVQDEIAAAVVGQLKITLLGEAPKAKDVGPKAYALFLQARQLGRQFTAASLEQSTALYQQALVIEPAYTGAWAGLASNYLNQVGNGLRAPEEGYGLAREAADKALAIGPDFAPAHAVLCQIIKASTGDLATATRHLEKALELEPGNLDMIGDAARHALSLGRFDTAFALQKFVLDRDPVNITGHHNLGLAYAFAGRLDEAIVSFRFVQSLSPDRLTEHYSIGETLLRKGDFPAALAEMQQEASDWKMVGLPMAYHALGRNTESAAALAELLEKGGARWAYNIAYVMAYLGEADRAFEWLDNAVAYHDAGVIDVANEPMLSNIHADPRWLPFLQKLGRTPEQLAAIPFDVKLPQQER